MDNNIQRPNSALAPESEGDRSNQSRATPTTGTARTPSPSLKKPPALQVPEVAPTPNNLAPTSSLAGISELTLAKGGKGGEGGTAWVSNTDFLAAVFSGVPDNAYATVCSKKGDPTTGSWFANYAIDLQQHCPAVQNNYVNCSSFHPGADGMLRARKDHFAACHFLLLDDLGSKVSIGRLNGFELSWLLETSPGNFQGGIILAEPILDGAAATQLLNAIINAGLCDPGASGPLSRWARLPVGINGKSKHTSDSGVAFRCRLVEWNPGKRYTPEEILSQLNLSRTPIKDEGPSASRSNLVSMHGNAGSHVYEPRLAQNPVITALKERGLYKRAIDSGKHEVTCPWVKEHTDALDNGSTYFEPNETHPIGGFCCMHSHRDKYHLRELLDFLGVPSQQAKHRSIIRISPGELTQVVNAAELELAAIGRHYQSGGLIVTLAINHATGDASIVPVSSSALTRELAMAAMWEKFDQRTQSWGPCDPPARHISILHDSQQFQYLKPLTGLARQPYFRESDGQLVTKAGYDQDARLFGIFDSQNFPVGSPSLENARDALKMLEKVLSGFHFVSEVDRAATLSAIFTAVVRLTLPYAPGFHVRAPVFGSGKSYLCELIGAFASPGATSKVSYPTTSEEATKVILSLLLSSPAVIEFDDMDTDWIPHGTIKRMLTAEHITDRILGISKTATVSTRCLFLSSGNNVGPVRDLLRRVLTIHVDPRCSTPATLSYQDEPVKIVQQNRGNYVAAVLTIILAWRNAGSPRTDVSNIATFGGEWSDYCRHPLIWLGCADPVTALLDQVKQDPDGDALNGLMTAWHGAFGSTATTVRKAVEAAAHGHTDLLDAMREFPIEDRGEINRSKLGWLLKKNANRIVGGFEFQKAEADGRTGWRVAAVNSPVLPPLPPAKPSTPETIEAAESAGFANLATFKISESDDKQAINFLSLSQKPEGLF